MFLPISGRLHASVAVDERHRRVIVGKTENMNYDDGDKCFFGGSIRFFQIFPDFSRFFQIFPIQMLDRVVFTFSNV
jgi:hypothetical protein